MNEFKNKPGELNINCTDPLGRTSLVIAIENESFELIEVLLDCGIEVSDALLHAISEDYVEAVELLLEWEEKHHKEGEPYVSRRGVLHFAARPLSFVRFPLLSGRRAGRNSIMKTPLLRRISLLWSSPPTGTITRS